MVCIASSTGADRVLDPWPERGPHTEWHADDDREQHGGRHQRQRLHARFPQIEQPDVDERRRITADSVHIFLRTGNSDRNGDHREPRRPQQEVGDAGDDAVDEATDRREEAGEDRVGQPVRAHPAPASSIGDRRTWCRARPGSVATAEKPSCERDRTADQHRPRGPSPHVDTVAEPTRDRRPRSRSSREHRRHRRAVDDAHGRPASSTTVSDSGSSSSRRDQRSRPRSSTWTRRDPRRTPWLITSAAVSTLAFGMSRVNSRT